VYASPADASVDDFKIDPLPRRFQQISLLDIISYPD
jgi:hypothetical protein